MPDDATPTPTPAAKPTIDPGTIGAQSRVERQMHGDEPTGFDPSQLDQARSTDLGKAPAKPEPKPEAKPEDNGAPTVDPPKTDDAKPSQLDPPRPMTRKKSADWDALKSSYEAKIAELQQQVQKGSANPDLDKLARERDELQKALREVAIERDPSFQREFSVQRDTAVNIAKMAAGAKGETLEKLLALPQSQFRDEQIDQLVSDLPQSSQRRVSAALSTLDQIEIARTAKIEHAKATWDQRNQEFARQQTEQQTERQKKMQTALERQLKEWQDPDKGHFLFNSGEQSEVQESLNLARQMISGELSESDMAKAALHVGSLPRLFKVLQETATERDALKEQLEKIQGSEPGDGTRMAPASGQTAKKVGDPGYEDEFISSFQAAQQQDQRGSW